LTRMDLWNLREREPASLSGGQKQRLALASVLAAETPILALDEPTTDLDPESAAAIVDLVRSGASGGRTVLHVTHDVESLGRADLIVAMKNGTIHDAATPGDLWRDPDRVRACGVAPPPLADLFARLGLAARPDSVESAFDALLVEGFRAISAGADSPPAPGETMARASGLTFGYQPDQAVVRDVDLEIRGGELVALVGANGCGKTTLVKLLAGILRPRAGQVRVGGCEVACPAPWASSFRIPITSSFARRRPRRSPSVHVISVSRRRRSHGAWMRRSRWRGSPTRVGAILSR
ncbi:MAG: ATP-binding cassette domain-containing protein, partial [Deltaproteobacteria bacterium]|nr:ATP-binding cassette domain-containing protein [Deltaproteobacteria bacterium]